MALKCKIIIFPGVVFFFFFFFHFFKILIFRVVRRVKGQKMAQNDKKLVAPYISGIMHYMIFIMVHMFERIIYPSVFLHFFKILIFGFNSGVKLQKMAQNDKKIMSVALHMSGSIHTSYGDHDFWHTCVK